MKFTTLLVALLLIGGAAFALPRHHAKSSDSVMVAKGYGKFNYKYLRLAVFFPSPGFGNPVASGFAGSEGFALRDDLPNQYRLGFESGNVRHFMKLNLGTQMLKFAINSGIAIQAFGKGNKERDDSKANTSGLFLVKLALGPQVTFKPINELRVGLFYRAGIAAFYTTYQNERRTVVGPDRVRIDKADAYFANYAYHGDLGLDVSYRAISVGVSYQMMALKPSKGAFIARDGSADEHNALTTSIEQNGTQEGDKIVTPIDPAIKFNRISVSLGFAL